MTYIAIAAVFFGLGLCYGRFWWTGAVVMQGRRRRNAEAREIEQTIEAGVQELFGTAIVEEPATLHAGRSKANQQSEPELSSEPTSPPKLGKKGKRKAKGRR